MKELLFKILCCCCIEKDQDVFHVDRAYIDPLYRTEEVQLFSDKDVSSTPKDKKKYSLVDSDTQFSNSNDQLLQDYDIVDVVSIASSHQEVKKIGSFSPSSGGSIFGSSSGPIMYLWQEEYEEFLRPQLEDMINGDLGSSQSFTSLGSKFSVSHTSKKAKEDSPLKNVTSPIQKKLTRSLCEKIVEFLHQNSEVYAESICQQMCLDFYISDTSKSEMINLLQLKDSES